ncbi:MAG: sigma-54 interaction domain-containing protein [Bryobacteraceae bacterium]
MKRPEPGIDPGLVGCSPAIEGVRRLIAKAARTRLPVLLLGESGTGKEVVARSIYAANPIGQFVPIDCGSLVGTLMESELFGHAKGSFSGAVADKKGLVELADGGTAFFDEIGDLPLEMQVKLLRLMQEREFRAVGSLQWRKVDLRIIAATHRHLEEEVERGRFRQDLYYRLNVLSIRLPALRDRAEDIPLLVSHFLARTARPEIGVLELPADIVTALATYEWPGNVRELMHAIERMAALHSEGAWSAADLPSPLQNHIYASLAATSELALTAGAEPCRDGAWESLPCEILPAAAQVVSPARCEACQRKAIAGALASTGGERAPAARLLGIGRTTLHRKMKKYGMA